MQRRKLFTAALLLASPASRGTLRIRLPSGAEQQFPSLSVLGEVVWGLTYRILEDFMTRVPTSLTVPPPTPR